MKANNLALYQQIKLFITSQVKAGIWQVNQKIPSENDFVEKFKASRMTINRALRELTAEGFLIRQQGVGTFIASPKERSALFQVKDISKEIKSRNNFYCCKIFRLTEILATESLALALDIREKTPVFHSIIVHYENKIPIQIEERYVNSLVVPNYLEQNFKLFTPYEYLEKVAPLTAGEHIVEAILAKPYECKLLKINQNEPCLLIRRRTWSDNKSVTYAKLIYPSSRYNLFGEFDV